MHITNNSYLTKLLLILLVMSFLTACDSKQNPTIYSRNLEYAKLLNDNNPTYHIEETERYENIFKEIENGAIINALDVEVYDLLKYHDYNVQKDCLLTIVIAVDRDLSDVEVQSWSDLAKIDASVYFPYDIKYQRNALSSIAYALNDNHFKYQKAINLLQKINEEGRLSFKDLNADVLITYDYDAINLISQGRNLEIIIPSEGTLSFALTSLSKDKIKPIDQDVLLNNCFRLIDGTSTNSNYPKTSEYTRATRLDDYDELLVQSVNATKSIRRQIMHTRFLSSADGSESIIFPIVVIIATLFWLASALYRSTNKDIKRIFRIVVSLIIFWLLIRITKYNIPASFIGRYCWYGYYIAMLGLPLSLLYTTIVIDRPSFKHSLPLWFKIIALMYPCFLIIIFTNDFHNLVFKFSDIVNEVYTYNFLFYVIFTYSLALFITSFALLVYKSRRSPKHNAFIYPLIMAILLVIYNVGYILNIPFIRDTDTTIIQCIFTIIFLEVVLRTGLIPNNTHYNALFASSPISMQIIDEEGHVINSSANVLNLSSDEITKILSAPAVSFNKNEDIIIHSHKINGGIAVWHEDISALNKLKKEITESIRSLELTNKLLDKNNEIYKRKVALDVQKKLFDSLEEDIKSETNELSSCIQKLSDDEIEIAYITLLLCHIKRRCNLFFLARADKSIPSDELSVYLDELSEFALYANIKALVRIADLGKLDVLVASLCYDFYFNLLCWAIKTSKATIIGQLEFQQASLIFKVLSSESLDTLVFDNNFNEHLLQLNAQIITRVLEDNREITLIIKLKEEKQDV